MKFVKTILLCSLVVLIAAGCNKKETEQVQNTQGTEQEQNQNAEENNEQNTDPGETVEYKNSFRSGFEENIYSVTYTFKYPKNLFTISPDGSNQSRILVKELGGNKTHEVNIFNNDGAGFASVNEFWTERKYCADCKKATGSINITGAKNVQVYENASSMWYVYAQDPGFVAIKIEKPGDEAKKVIESFQLSSVLIE